MDADLTSRSFKQRLTDLYVGDSRGSAWFRYGLIAFDLLTIVYFIATGTLELPLSLKLLNLLIAVVILADFAARVWIAEDRRALLTRVYMLADLIVVGSLFAAPFLHSDLGFLRILRALRIIHAYHLLEDLRATSAFFRRHEDALIATVNLFVFVFFTTSCVFVLFFKEQGGAYGYVDALYFTVTTLTTTGYGDITPKTAEAKLFSVFIMVVGVALFVQLARAVIRPTKVRHTCKSCGLTRHELDAVHCKHCGATLQIETSGLS